MCYLPDAIFNVSMVLCFSSICKLFPMEPVILNKGGVEWHNKGLKLKSVFFIYWTVVLTINVLLKLCQSMTKYDIFSKNKNGLFDIRSDRKKCFDLNIYITLAMFLVNQNTVRITKS